MTELGSLAQRAALLACVLLSFQYAWAATRTSDVNALNEISQAWSGSISGLNWQGDPCDSKWTGVVCNNETVVQLSLDSRNLVGSIPSAIGNLTGLELLELSNNKDLGGPLPTEIGNLENLEILSIQYSGLSGSLPPSLGKLRHLNFLGLNGNNLSGQIPAELGLTNITWLDLSVNRFSGEIPLIRNSIEGIGLDSIAPIVHYHLNNNSLNGSIPGELFAMPRVLHLLLDHNAFTGPLPSNITVSGRLQILRLDVNQLTGEIPSGLLNAANITDLNLKSNQFSGPLPNMSTLQNLVFLDMSDNGFDPSAVPSWITSLSHLSTLNMANLSLFGEVPAELFDISSIEKLDLSGNDLNGTLTFSGTTSPSLMEVDLDQNDISGFAGQPSSGTNLSLSLVGNPLCTNSFVTPVNSCAHPLGTFQNPANSNCSESSSCEGGREYNFKACRCAYPLELHILLTSPAFYNLNQAATPLEKALADPGRLNLREDQAYISNMNYTWDARVNVFLWVFPETGDHLDGGVGDNITNRLRHHLFNLPSPWGPYLLPDNTYAASTGGHGLSTSSIVGIAVGSTVGFLVIALSVLLALYHKRRADKAMMSNPFASWGGGSAEFGEAPKLKGARWFSLAELKAYTNNWSDDNQIGVGGYGKVYRGTLPNGDFIAIKRATEGSLQGANEFKTEIELLSRVHHRNLLGLVGFSYEGGEQALIYEFMSEGTLYDHLKGRDEGPLSWEWRLEIALASARGLAYLHDHASPPIIHRDVKSANILLNEKLVAKVADFGLSKLAPEEGEKAVYSVHVKGTLGYLDPEYYMTQNLTDKSDVYSFGVVLLEMLTARPPIVGNMYVVREFRTALDKGGARALRPLLDPAIADVPEKELDIYVAIAMNCVAEDGASRPFMAEVVKEFEALNGPEAGVRSMDVEGTGPGAKKVKFADNVLSESDKAKLLKNKSPEDTARRYQKANERAPGPFQYSGDFAGSTTVRPK